MKKSKLFILLPFLALTLSGCNTTTISQPSSNESSSEESMTTEDKGYSSYTLSFSFIYQGDLQYAPDGSTIYYAGDTNGWSFTPLKEDEGSYKLELGAIEYGTYSYKLLIEYDDEEVGWDKEVYPKNADNSNATFTVSESDGGSQSIECTLLSYTLEDILGSKSEGGDTGGDQGQGEGGDTGGDEGKGEGGDTEGSETSTYSIVLNNADELETMEYDASLDDQKGVELDISLVTTSSTGETSSKTATADDVSFQVEGDDIIYISDLIVYPRSSGETSFTISWSEVDATPITVSVKIANVTQEVVTSLSNYTLRFNLTYNGAADTIPDGAELRILGSWDNTDSPWTNYHVLTTQEDGSYTYTFDEIDVLAEEEDWYSYVLVLGYSDQDWVNWNYELLFSEDTYLTFEVTGEQGNNYINNIALELTTPMSSLISGLISDYELTVTIYYGENIETLPTWADLYINGTWANSEELGYSNFEKLTPNDDRTEFAVTIHDVHPGWYDYDLVMVETGAAASWTHKITTDNSKGYFEIATGEMSGTSSYTSENSLETIFPDPSTVGTVYNYTVSFNISYGGNTTYQLNDYVALYIQGDFDGDDVWEDPIEMTTTDHITYSYTFTEISEESHQCTIYYNYTNMTNFGEEDWKMKVAENVYFTPNTTSLPIVLSVNFDINETLTDPNQEEEGEIAKVDSYTLTFTLYNANSVVQKCPKWGSLYIQGSIGGDYITDSEGYSYYQWSDWEKLEEDANGTYSKTYDNVIPGEYYEFNIIFVYSNDAASASYDQKVNIDGGNLNVTIADEATAGGSQDVTISGCYTLAEQYPERTSVNTYTLVFTLYDGNGEVQTCPSYGKFQIQGEFDGTENAGGWIDWGPYHDLTQTTDASDNTAYEVSFSNLEVEAEYEFNIVFFYTDNSLNTIDWPTIRSTNFKVTISGDSSGVQYEDLTDCYTLSSRYTETGINNSEDAIDITIALKDSGSSSGINFSIYSEADNTEHQMNKADGSSAYDQYYTYSYDKNKDLTWNIHLTGETGYGINTEGATTGLGNNTTIDWADSNYHLWASYQTWGLTLSTLTTPPSGWSTATSLTVILTFSFASYTSGSQANWLVSGFSFILA